MKRTRRVFDLVGLDSVSEKEEDLSLSSGFFKKCKFVPEEEEIRTLADMKNRRSEGYELSFSEESDASGEEEDISQIELTSEEIEKSFVLILSSRSAFKLHKPCSPVDVKDKLARYVCPKVEYKNIFRQNSPVTVARRSSFDTRTSLAGTTFC